MNSTVFRYTARLHLRAMLAALLCLFLFSARQLSAQADPRKTAESPKADTPAPAPAAAPADAAGTPAPKAAEPKTTDVKVLKTTRGGTQNESKWTPFQLALFEPVQIFSSSYVVKGLNWNFLYSNNVHIYGFDMSPTGATESRSFGGVQITAAGLSDEMNGVQFALFGDFSNVARGVQFCPIDISFNEMKRFSGFKIVGVGPYSEIRHMDGALIAPFFSFTQTMTGFQMSLAHCGAEKANGFQLGGFIEDGEFNGVQMGLFNRAKKMSGVQFGFLNVCPGNWLPYSFLLNVGF